MNSILSDYFEGTIGQMLERARHLRGIVPRRMEAEFQTLNATCRSALDTIVDSLENLQDDPTYKDPAIQGLRLREYRRIVTELDEVENVAVAALARKHPDDLFLNRLVGKIADEINYPLVPPVVTCLSQDYYHIYPHFNLLCVPLAEARFLLHLPDLYHELGHAVLSDRNHPDAEAYQKALLRAFFAVKGYLAQQKEDESLARAPSSFARNLDLWEQCWLESWISEFFCDLFAVYALGPAYAWSHFHLCAKQGQDPMIVPPAGGRSHPCDEARTTVLLNALNLLGFVEEAFVVQERWEVLSGTVTTHHQPEYVRCFPDDLLAMLARMAFDGYQAMGCHLATKNSSPQVRASFTLAWENFWKSPKSYVHWEAQEIEELKALCV